MIDHGAPDRLVASLLPEDVVCVEVRGHGEPVGLFPEEELVVRRAVAKRRREFASVRRCAREALTRLGHAPVPLLPGERGAPLWPDGVVGSLTHTDGYAAAAVAHTGAVTSVGIDVEERAPLPDGVLGLVARPEEAGRVRHLQAGDPSVPWDRLLFSAKESVYKAWFPITGRWLGFEDARLTLDPGSGTFVADLLVDAPVRRFEGRWLVADVVATAVVHR